MSIIYEALKKVDKPEKKKKFFLPRNFLWLVILGLAVYLIISYLLKKEHRLAGEIAKEEKQSQLTPPAAQPPLPVPAAEPNETTPSFTLSGIVYSQQLPLAVINGQALKKGQDIEGAKILDIQEDKVILEKDGKNITLFLK